MIPEKAKRKLCGNVFIFEIKNSVANKTPILVKPLATFGKEHIKKDEASAVRRLRVGIYVKNNAVVSLIVGVNKCSFSSGQRMRRDT